MGKDFDITTHVLVPEHSKLADKEKKELLERYNIEIKELPLVKLDDPAIQKLNPQPGDVIKIRRLPDTPEQVTFYRAVVE